MRLKIGYGLAIAVLFTVPFAEAKRPKKKDAIVPMGMPDLQSVLGGAYQAPLELSDRAMPGAILEVTPYGYRPIMSGCVGKEPVESAFTNITMQSSLSGGVSFGIGGQGASAAASQSVGLKFISPYILGFEMVDFEPSAECKSKMKSYAEKKGYDNLVVVQEALFARINGCSEASASAQGKVQSIGVNAAMSTSCQMFSNEPVAVGVRLVELSEFMGIAVRRQSASVPVALAPATPAVAIRQAVEISPAPVVSGSHEGFETVVVPGGTFMMGCLPSDGDCGSDEKPRHKVTISHAMEVMTTEVTQGLYESVMGQNPSHFSSCGKNCPVEQVSWYDAVAFANALSRKEGLSECYSISGTNVSWSDVNCSGWRLPTEAEWEYLARGGGEEHMYSGSNRIGDVAWYGSNSRSKTHPVGQKQANGFGLYDMTGNVWEWTWDWKGRYSSDSVTDPRGPSSGSNRVRRGGSWGSSAGRARASYRSYSDPSNRVFNLGFRFLRRKN